MSTATITGGKLELTGNGYGWASAVKTLPAAPATTKRMVFAWRGWMDSYSSGDTVETNLITDPLYLFGLRFSPTMPQGDLTILPGTSQGADGDAFRAIASDFFGLAGYCSNATAEMIKWAGTTYNTNTLGCHGTISGVYYFTGFFSAYEGATTSLEYGANVATDDLAKIGFPCNPTTGAKFTGIWDIYASDIDNKVYCRCYINLASVSVNDLFGAVDDPSIWQGGSSDTGPMLIHGNITGTNWRNADGTMNFPRYLMLRYPFKAQKMVLDHYKVAYYDSVTS